MAIKDYVKGYMDNGAAQALVTVGLLTLYGELVQRGVLPSMNGGSSDWSNTGDESVSYGEMNRGSSVRNGSGSAAKGSYREFVSQNLSHYIEQGYSAQDAMKKVAADWRNR